MKKFDLSAAIATQETAPVARTIEDVTRDILRNKARAAQAFVEIGHGLIEAKALLPHGEWLPWLHEQVNFTERHAQTMMQLARECANTKSISYLDMSKATIVLKLPAPERERFITTPHEVDGVEKMPADMTTGELRKVVSEVAPQKKVEIEQANAPCSHRDSYSVLLRSEGTQRQAELISSLLAAAAISLSASEIEKLLNNIPD